MAKRIPPPGKKWARNKISYMAGRMSGHMYDMKKTELKAIIATAEQFTMTNCGWLSYLCKDIVVKIAKDILSDRALLTKQKSKALKSKHLKP